MTPERIAVTGFLCYRDTQTATFADRSLWMLAGPNGSGKSTLFDAITFALYGLHRGGKQNAAAIINRHSDVAIIEFDFRLGDDLYQARRTIRRKKNRGQADNTQQMRRFIPDAMGDGGRWEEVAGTDSARGFQRWVESYVGLTDSTFTASVMLRQGQADRLLEADPAARHRFLAEIVGLDRYERLHARASENRREAKTRAAFLGEQLESCPKVSDEELEAARDAETVAQQESEQIAAQVQVLSARHIHAVNWQRAVNRKQEFQAELSIIEQLLSEAETIRSRWERSQWLGKHLPSLQNVIELHTEQQGIATDFETLMQSARDRDTRQTRLIAEQTRQQAVIDGLENDAARLNELITRTDSEQTELGTALPWLETIVRERENQDATQSKIAEAQSQQTKLQTRRDKLELARPSDVELQSAEERFRTSRTELATAAAECRAIEQQHQRFHDVADERACPHCGQSLPAEHVQAEAARLDDARQHARNVCQNAQYAHDQAQTVLQALQERLHVNERSVQEWEQESNLLKQTLASARQTLVESRKRESQSRAALPTAFRDPNSSTDPGDLRRQCTELANRLRELRDELQELNRQLDDHRTAHADCMAALADCEREATETKQQTQRLDVRAEHLRNAIAQAEQELPAECQAKKLTDLQEQHHRWQIEWDDLNTVDVQHEYAQLQQAEQKHASIQDRLTEIEQQIAAVPANARRSPESVSEELARTRQSYSEADARLQTTRQHTAELERHREAREKWDQEFRQADRQRYLWERLTNLLGRGGLQRDLVGRAERQIVEYANAILDRVSGGTLHIELRPDGERTKETAFDLLARTATETEPLDVSMLSGSQRFRVAVAISLGIGQYAGDVRRPVRSVVIDEGFGCLDRDNRQVMISELHNLKSHLDRIILVSHQDEFATAFPDGYHCEPSPEGTTLVPFHR